MSAREFRLRSREQYWLSRSSRFAFTRGEPSVIAIPPAIRRKYHILWRCVSPESNVYENRERRREGRGDEKTLKKSNRKLWGVKWSITTHTRARLLGGGGGGRDRSRENLHRLSRLFVPLIYTRFFARTGNDSFSPYYYYYALHATVIYCAKTAIRTRALETNSTM